MLHYPRRAFTLVEIMIVVLLLGLLAAIVLPQFTTATQDTRDTSVKTNLQYIRGQIELFKSQHNENPPQLAGLWNLMQTSSASTETNLANPTGAAVGPYLKGTPLNPWNGLTTVNSAATDSAAGWYYTASANSYDLRIRNLDGSINTNY